MRIKNSRPHCEGGKEPNGKGYSFNISIPEPAVKPVMSGAAPAQTQHETGNAKQYPAIPPEEHQRRVNGLKLVAKMTQAINDLPLSKAASLYASVGCAVYPLNGKDPRNWGGFRCATSDLDQVRTWWQLWPHANIGMALPDGLLVVDIDPVHGGKLNYISQLLGLGKSFPTTLNAQTSLRHYEDDPAAPLEHGRHFYFQAPPGIADEKRNGTGIKVNWCSKIKEFPGVDILPGTKGGMVMPPSIHPDTKDRYLWVNEPGNDPYYKGRDCGGINPFPPAAVDLLFNSLKKEKESQRKKINTPKRAGTGHQTGNKKSQAYMGKAIEGMARDIATAPQGNRNNTFNAKVFKATRLGASNEQLDQLVEAARQAGLSESEIRSTFASATRGGAA